MCFNASLHSAIPCSYTRCRRFIILDCLAKPSALGVNKTCAPPLTYALLLFSVPLSGEVHYLDEMVTEFVKHPVVNRVCE